MTATLLLLLLTSCLWVRSLAGAAPTRAMADLLLFALVLLRNAAQVRAASVCLCVCVCAYAVVSACVCVHVICALCVCARVRVRMYVVLHVLDLLRACTCCCIDLPARTAAACLTRAPPRSATTTSAPRRARVACPRRATQSAPSSPLAPAASPWRRCSRSSRPRAGARTRGPRATARAAPSCSWDAQRRRS